VGFGLALLTALALFCAGTLTGAAAKPKPKPKGTYAWTLELHAHHYYFSDCTAWGVNRKITENHWTDERESGRGSIGKGSNVSYGGSERRTYSVVNTYPDGNQTQEDENSSGELPSDQGWQPSGQLTVKGDEVQFKPITGPVDPGPIKVRFAPLKPGKSRTIKINLSENEQPDLEEGCNSIQIRHEVTGTLTIKRIR
jgi:hypothetical protein